jgi:hypothetical protein
MRWPLDVEGRSEYILNKAVMDNQQEVVLQVGGSKLDLVRVQEVRWNNDGTEPADKYIFLYGKGNKYHELGTRLVLCIRESY